MDVFDKSRETGGPEVLTTANLEDADSARVVSPELYDADDLTPKGQSHSQSTKSGSYQSNPHYRQHNNDLPKFCCNCASCTHNYFQCQMHNTLL